METQKKIEHEINLMEVFWNILFSWRQIICFGIIFAIIFGSTMYARDVKKYRTIQDSAVNQPEDKLEKEESKLTEEEKAVILDIRELEARIKENHDYLNSSVRMQIDPYEEHVLNLQYYVESDYVYNYTKDNQRDYTADIMSAYYNYATGGEMIYKIINETGLSICQEDLNELWDVRQEGTSLKFSVAYPEKNALNEIADAIKALLGEKEKEWQQIGSHRLCLLNESDDVKVDNDLLERKNTILNNISNMEAQIKALKATMTEEQLKILNGDEEEEDEQKKDKGSLNISKPTFEIKYMFLGVFTGFFLICVWIVCKMLFDMRLQNPQEIRTLYDERLLGEITFPQKRKRFLAVVDEKILAIKNRRRKKLSTEQQIKRIVVNIVLFCKKHNIENIYMTGSEYGDLDTQILDLLKQELESQHLRVEEGENIFYDAVSMKRGTEIGNVLFVEQTGKSTYDEIFNELNLAKEQNNNVLGIVVLQPGI